MKKNKYYTVWAGRKTGVFSTWEETKKATDGYPGSEFKSFDSLEYAEAAFNRNSSDSIERELSVDQLLCDRRLLIGDPLKDSFTSTGIWFKKENQMIWRITSVETGCILDQTASSGGSQLMANWMGVVSAFRYLLGVNTNAVLYSDDTFLINRLRDLPRGFFSLVRPYPLSTSLLRTNVGFLNNCYHKTICSEWHNEWGAIPGAFGV